MSVAELLGPEFWGRWVAIMILNLILSGDNAVVIALAVRNLPRHKAWQGRLWGTVGAVALRVAFTGVVAALLGLPLLQALGGVLLVWIAVRLLIQESGGAAARAGGAGLFEAVWIIIVADLVMSLDNVLAVAAAAGGNLLLIVLGVGLSIPIVIWGAGILARLMGRLPWLVDLGAAILGWVAGEMIVKDRLVGRGIAAGGGALRLGLSAGLALGVVGAGRWITGRRLARSGTAAGSR